MVGKNVELFIERMAEDYKAELLAIFNSEEDLNFGEYGSFYQEGCICDVEGARKAYQLDVQAEQVYDLTLENQFLKRELERFKKLAAANITK